MSRLLASHHIEAPVTAGALTVGAALAELESAAPRAEVPDADEVWLDAAAETTALDPPPAPSAIGTVVDPEMPELAGTPEPAAEPVASEPRAVPATATVALRLESGVLPEAAPEPIDAPIVLTGAVAGVEAVPPAALQATPDPEASAILPETGVTEERDWLRGTLGAEYGLQANAVGRILSEHPGFQGALVRSKQDVLTDAVAVRLHLSQPGAAIDMALRTNTVGPHVPFARCVVSGLNRLPSHRGPAVFAASPTPAQLALYDRQVLLTEWSFVHALTAPCAAQEGDTDVVIWSMSARRTKLLEPAAESVPDRVVFVPGTCFKLLRRRPATAGERGQILLRELTAGEITEDGHVDVRRGVLDDMAVTSLTEQIERWSMDSPERRVGDLAAERFGALPGLA
jgi:hypothetical protein